MSRDQTTGHRLFRGARHIPDRSGSLQGTASHTWRTSFSHPLLLREARRSGLRTSSRIPLYEVDPLVCPRYQGVMRVISFITEGRVIRRILDHLGGAKRPQRALRKLSPGGAAPLRCGPPGPFEPVPTISRTVAENQSSYHLINASASSPGPPGGLILE